jgi:hypothetical protein
MPMKKSDYPLDWKQISKAAIERAGNKCEMCYAPNKATVFRYGSGAEYPWSYKDMQGDGKPKPLNPLCSDIVVGMEDAGLLYNFPQNIKPTKIVLTVHHIDSNKYNNDPANLLACCQKCHLRLDKAKHIANSKATRQKRIDAIIIPSFALTPEQAEAFKEMEQEAGLPKITPIPPRVEGDR